MKKVFIKFASILISVIMLIPALSLPSYADNDEYPYPRQMPANLPLIRFPSEEIVALSELFSEYKNRLAMAYLYKSIVSAIKEEIPRTYEQVRAKPKEVCHYNIKVQPSKYMEEYGLRRYWFEDDEIELVTYKALKDTKDLFENQKYLSFRLTVCLSCDQDYCKTFRSDTHTLGTHDMIFYKAGHKGDLNLDGIVNLRDLVIMKKMILGIFNRTRYERDTGLWIPYQVTCFDNDAHMPDMYDIYCMKGIILGIEQVDPFTNNIYIFPQDGDKIEVDWSRV